MYSLELNPAQRSRLANEERELVGNLNLAPPLVFTVGMGCKGGCA
jgi:hypothetical protein